jgi:deoxyhypusine monooxygenase
MARHEVAGTLGGIGTPEVLLHLKEWMVRDGSLCAVRECRQVAIYSIIILLGCLLSDNPDS